MTILDAITSSPLNVFFTIVIGIGLAYLYYKKPSSSSSSSSSTSSTSYSGRASSRGAFLAPNSVNAGLHSSSVGTNQGFIDEELQRAIAQIEAQERDMIRKEQDEAYLQSLQADREKKQKREEELRDKEAKEKAERERKIQIEELHRRLNELKIDIVTKLPRIPDQQDDGSSIVKLVFKLPDGTRVKQNFSKIDKIKHLYWFVFSLKNAPLQFKLTTNFPKRDLPGRPPAPEDFESAATTNSAKLSSIEDNCEQSLEEAGLTETQIIFIYDLEA